MESLQELLAQKASIEQRIAEAARVGRADAMLKIRALANEYGLTPVDLTRAIGGKMKAPAVPKYRDAMTGASWTGHGRKPGWLAAAVAQGKPLESFLIGAPAMPTSTKPAVKPGIKRAVPKKAQPKKAPGKK